MLSMVHIFLYSAGFPVPGSMCLCYTVDTWEDQRMCSLFCRQSCKASISVMADSALSAKQHTDLIT